MAATAERVDGIDSDGIGFRIGLESVPEGKELENAWLLAPTAKELKEEEVLDREWDWELAEMDGYIRNPETGVSERELDDAPRVDTIIGGVHVSTTEIPMTVSARIFRTDPSGALE